MSIVKYQKGFIAITSVIVIGAVIVLLIIGIIGISVGEIERMGAKERGEEAFSLANLCMEIALNELREENGDWLDDWAYRIPLIVDSSKIDQDLTHFPITVFLKAGNGETAKIFDKVGVNKLKIAIADDSNPPVQYYVEIEHWDEVSKEGVLHFGRTGEILPSAEDKTFYIYYDNAKLDNTDYVGETQSAPAKNVWDANFRAVYHLGDVNDSTVNAFTLTNINSVPFVAAKIAKGADFEENFSQSLDRATNLFGSNVFTLEVWFKPEQTPPNDDYYYLFSDPCDYGVRVAISYFSSAGVQYLEFGRYDTTSWKIKRITVTLPTNAYSYIVLVSDTANSLMRCYINGVEVGTIAIATNLRNWVSPTRLGTNIGPGPWYADGIEDEVRISNTNRSAAWIKADYNSGNDSLLTYVYKSIAIGEGECYIFMDWESDIITIKTEGEIAGYTRKIEAKVVKDSDPLEIISWQEK